VTEQLCSSVMTLRAMGISTPEICRELGVDSDTVIRLLIQGEQAISSGPIASLPERREGNGSQAKGRHLMDKLISTMAKDQGSGRLPVWTFPDLSQAMQNSAAAPVSRDTLRRYLSKEGFTFPDYLNWVTSSTVIPDAVAAMTEASRGLLYVVSHRIYRTVDPVTTLLAGLTPSNRLALLARHQGRLSPRMVMEFLEALLDLHKGRHLVILIRGDGVGGGLARDAWQRRQRRLHLYFWRGSRGTSKQWINFCQSGN
jgi:hypothetical protein